MHVVHHLFDSPTMGWRFMAVALWLGLGRLLRVDDRPRRRHGRHGDHALVVRLLLGHLRLRGHGGRCDPVARVAPKEGLERVAHLGAEVLHQRDLAHDAVDGLRDLLEADGEDAAQAPVLVALGLRHDLDLELLVLLADEPRVAAGVEHHLLPVVERARDGELRLELDLDHATLRVGEEADGLEDAGLAATPRAELLVVHVDDAGLVFLAQIGLHDEDAAVAAAAVHGEAKLLDRI